MRSILRSVKNAVTTLSLRPFARLGMYKKFLPSKGHIHFGDFDRVTPFSTNFGYDRGGPVDRHYIENFLQANASLIHGRVLEIGDNDYTVKFGKEMVTKSDILYIDDTNPQATIIADLADARNIDDNLFDCIVLTQTLHVIYDVKAVIRNCYRILKPGGTLLLTVPGISHIDQGNWGDYWFWSFTRKAISNLLLEQFSEKNVSIETFGNVKIATAFLHGIGAPELRPSDFTYNDPHYQVIITAVARK